MNVWNLYDVNNKKSIYDDLSIFIYNYDYTDNEMYDLLVELESLIV